MDELGKSLPVSESMIEGEQRAEAAGNPNCLNCSAPLTGKINFVVRRVYGQSRSKTIIKFFLGYQCIFLLHSFRIRD